MKIRIPLLIFVLGASLLHSQVQAPDASDNGPFVVFGGNYTNGASALDQEVLPGCIPTAGVYDCNVQETGEFYYPGGAGGALTGTHPVLIFLHGNHATCGHAYNPPPGGTDPPGLPGTPRLDFGPGFNAFTGTGACGNAANPTVVPSYRGYDYLANQLASWGYVVLSMDANRGITGVNAPAGVAQDYRLIRARGVLVLKTLQMLANWNVNGDVPGSAGDILQGHLDLTNVGLMGHSRGGEGVRAALSLFNDITPTPMNATDFWAANPWPARIPGLNIKAIYEIAPTDSGIMVVPPAIVNFDATGTVWNVLLPMCDGDVSNLQGVRPFDRAIMDLEEPPIQKSTYTVWGANHNFFNTQWQLSDGTAAFAAPFPSICTGAGNTAIFPVSPGSTNQTLVGLSSVPALMRGNVGVGTLPAAAASVTFNQNFNPPFGIPATSFGVAFPTRIDRGYSPPGDIETFDDFTVAGFNSTAPAVPHVAANVAVAYGTVPEHDPVLSQAANISWAAAAAGNFFQTNWTPNGRPGVDITEDGYQTLDLRISREDNAVNVAGGTNFSISLVGANGVMTRSLQVADYIDPNFAGANAAFESNLTGPVGSTIELHPILQTVRIPLTDFGNYAFIAPQLHGVRLTFDQTATGSIYVTNIRLSTQIGGGAATYPEEDAILAAASAPAAQPLVAPVSPSPIVNSASIVSITPVPNAAEVGGVSGYRLLVQSTSGDFPVRNESIAMVIGNGSAPPLADPLTVLAGFDPVVSGKIVFTLTPAQYHGLSGSAHIILQFGDSSQPSEYWDAGLLSSAPISSPAPATLIAPASGSKLPSNPAFSWTTGSGATAYWLNLGTSPTGANSKNLYSSGQTTNMGAAVTGLPAYGATVYATLYSEIAGVWQPQSYTYTESGSPAPAAIASPLPGTLTSTSVTFTWTSGNNVQQYWFNLGTANTGTGAKNIYSGSSTTLTSATVSGLPNNGETIYATLYSYINGAWQPTVYTYTAAGSPTPAALLTPTPGVTLAGASVTFSWSAGSNVQHYWFNLGTAASGASAKNIYSGSSTTATSVTVNNLPTNGETIYATLYSWIGGAWQPIVYTYKTQ